MSGRPGIVTVGAALAAGVSIAFAAGCGSQAASVSVPDGHAGAAPGLIRAYGCGSCHTISGVRGADGEVGPSLVGFADRRTVAGMLPNTPTNLVRWIMHPQAVAPGTIMPDLDVGESEARDIAAYLYRH